ncbi:MAG: hypothetical protein ABW250_12865 [Pyrinomonadaceae bacterium]
MKHRSVIAYVIVAAAMFAAPQLSHDLQALRSALGSRVSVGLMRTFLSLPSAEGADARVGEPRPAETQLASCPKQRQAAKPRKAEPARAEARTADVAGDEWAMIEPPMLEPPPHESLREVAMIIPPDAGIDPRGAARAAADAPAARVDAAENVRRAEKVRVNFVATRFEAKGGEWQKVEQALRNIEGSLPGTYEFRLDRDGVKTKVLKFRRAPSPCCAPAPAPAPRAPRPTGVDAVAAWPMPASAVGAHVTFVSE